VKETAKAKCERVRISSFLLPKTGFAGRSVIAHGYGLNPLHVLRDDSGNSVAGVFPYLCHIKCRNNKH